MKALTAADITLEVEMRIDDRSIQFLGLRSTFRVKCACLSSGAFSQRNIKMLLDKFQDKNFWLKYESEINSTRYLNIMSGLIEEHH